MQEDVESSVHDVKEAVGGAGQKVTNMGGNTSKMELQMGGTQQGMPDFHGAAFVCCPLQATC